MKTIVKVLHTYGARALLLLFFDHQDTESESYETIISISRPIFTQVIYKGSMGKQYQYSTRWEKTIVAIIHIYWARAVF